jgi:hypothetical protein
VRQIFHNGQPSGDCKTFEVIDFKGKPGDVRYCRDEVAAVTAWFALHPPANKNIK